MAPKDFRVILGRSEWLAGISEPFSGLQNGFELCRTILKISEPFSAAQSGSEGLENHPERSEGSDRRFEKKKA
jgi:hypothetical protein